MGHGDAKRVNFVSETATANGNRSSRAGGVASDSNADTPVGLGAPSLFLQMSSSGASTRRHQTRSAADETGRVERQAPCLNNSG